MDELLDKYTAALQKHSSLTAKGTVVEADGNKFPLELFSKIPGQRISIIQRARGDSIVYGYGDGIGWVFGEDGPPHELPSDETGGC